MEIINLVIKMYLCKIDFLQFMKEQKLTYSVSYFKQFDGARGLLAFSIFILHLHFTFIKVPSTLANFTLHSFFVASAFLITKILLKDKQKSPTFKSFFVQFYVKRILRIFPVYFGYIFLLILIAVFTKLTWFHDFAFVITEIKRNGWMLFTFTYNFKDLKYILLNHGEPSVSSLFGHLWSISLEEQFYIVIPFLIYFLSEKSLKRLAFVMIFTFPVIRILGYFYLQQKTDNYLLLGFAMIRNTFFQFDAFFYGILIALLPKIDLKIIRRFFYTTIAMIVVQEVLNLSIIQHQFGIPFYKIISQYDIYARCGASMYIDILLNASCFCFLYLVFNTEAEFPLLLNNRLVEYGKFSFGSYVYQYLFIMPCYYLIYQNLIKIMPIIFAELITAFVCLSTLMWFSRISYYSFEMYFLKKKEVLTKKLLRN